MFFWSYGQRVKIEIQNLLLFFIYVLLYKYFFVIMKIWLVVEFVGNNGEKVLVINMVFKE